MDAKQQRPSPTSPAAVAAAISKVLKNDDLLGEVLLRLIFPTSLVRAAAVCRRWLRVASDPAFLRRFRDLHPPRLLGLYVTSKRLNSTSRFVPTPHPPMELAAVVRRAGTIPELASGVATRVSDCQNGRILMELNNRATVRIISPLHPAAGEDAAAVVLPPPPPFPGPCFHRVVMRLKALNADGVAYAIMWGIVLHWSSLSIGAWHSVTSPALELPFHSLGSTMISHPLNGKIYLMYCCASDIVTLPSALSTLSYLSIIALPDGVDCKPREKVKPWVDDSGIYLIPLKELQLHVWIYMTDHCKWSLHDIICLREVCGSSTHGLSAATMVKAHEVGHSAEFVLLQVGVDVLYVNIRSRIVEKFYTIAPEDGSSVELTPFMMIWPPIFPSTHE